MARGVVEFEERGGRCLGEERFEHRRIRRDDRLEQAEGGRSFACGAHCSGVWCRGGGAGGLAGVAVPKQVRLALVLRAHAGWLAAESQRRSSSLTPGGAIEETCRRASGRRLQRRPGVRKMRRGDGRGECVACGVRSQPCG